mgnify:CR=1 FL=1
MSAPFLFQPIEHGIHKSKRVMRLSKGFIPTVKETPNDAIIPSHQLMIRAGMVRLLGAGIYSWLPLGYKVMKKVCEIVREEMDAIGGQEFHLPALNPIEIWEETGRAQDFGAELFRLKDRKERPYCLAPTHEEIVCSPCTVTTAFPRPGPSKEIRKSLA